MVSALDMGLSFVARLSVLWGGGDPYWPGGSSFRAIGGLVVVPRIEGLAGAPRLLGFILLLGCSGALLVVSALGVFWDCHLRPVFAG